MNQRFLFICCLLSIVCGLVFFTAGCATTYNPATERQEYIFIDSRMEAQIGRGMSEDIIRKKEEPLNSPAKQLLLNRIGNRLVGVCDRKDIIYHFMILDNPDLNAFCLPGGYVYVYSGLFNRTDEAALAAILAHEIGHTAARHAVKKMQSALGFDVMMGLALFGLGQKNPELEKQIAWASDIVYDLLSRGYSREDELLADKLAVKYLRLAGYDPYGMIRVLELLKNQAGPGGRVFEVLSTHPRMEERIRKCREEIERPKNID